MTTKAEIDRALQDLRSGKFAPRASAKGGGQQELGPKGGRGAAGGEQQGRGRRQKGQRGADDDDEGSGPDAAS